MLDKASLSSIQQALRLVEILQVEGFDLALLSRIFRAKKGISIEVAAAEISKSSGIKFSRQLLSQIEEGKNTKPQKAKLIAMAKFYGHGFVKGLQDLGLVEVNIDIENIF